MPKKPRISLIKPRLKTMAPRLGPATRAEKEEVRLRERDQSVEWRAWYKTARWQRLREQVIQRDLYTCQATGVLLTGKHPAGNSPVVDHIEPHKGDPVLFWSIDNLRCVAKSWHDSVKQAAERAERRGPWL